MKKLNLGPPNTNLSCDREEDLSPGSPDYKSSALNTWPRLLQMKDGKYAAGGINDKATSILSAILDNDCMLFGFQVRCLPLSSSIRETIGQSMLQARVKVT